MPLGRRGSQSHQQTLVPNDNRPSLASTQGISDLSNVNPRQTSQHKGT